MDLGVNSKCMSVNVRWEQQKEYVRNKLPEEETGTIYGQ
ncbi:hypothetical protein B4134_0826 [Bacillus safensis]|nr:hypothetical protein B4134_0826 [Bacillus safensis]